MADANNARAIQGLKGPWAASDRGLSPKCVSIPEEVCRDYPFCVGCPAESDVSMFDADPVPEGLDGEVRVVDPATGGEKGQKLARYDLIPVRPLRDVAELYGEGAKKYAERNWERGYDWSLSYAALQRHANAFWGGEDFLPDMPNVRHLTAVAWHALALLEFAKTHPQGDDRVKPRHAVVNHLRLVS